MSARSHNAAWGAAVAILFAFCTPAQAQQGPISMEVITGHAGYVDEAWDNRLMVGGNVRRALTPRWALGPELVYQRGFDDAHELLVTGSATYDLVGSSGPGRRLVPFVIVSAGIARRSSLVGRGPDTPGLARYTVVEPTASAGLGVRVVLTPAFFISGDARLGWEPERRVTATLGWRP